MEESTLHLELASETDVKRTITGRIEWAPVKDKLDEAYKELGKNITLKGFRKGKVPRSMLAKMFHKRIAAEIAHNLVQEALVDAIKRLELRPVLPIPSWDVEEGELVEGEPLGFTATLEVLPEVTVTTWEGLEVSQREAKVDEEEVDRFLAYKQEELTQFVPVEGEPIAQQHILRCDVMGKVADEPVSMEGMAFMLTDVEPSAELTGEDAKRASMIYLLSKELLGKPATPGELDVEVTFGSWAAEPWRDQPAQLLVELLDVRERRVPELDDEFARDVGEADTLTEYREIVRTKLMEEDEKSVKQELRRALEDRLIEANPIEVTDTLVEKQLNAVMERAELAFRMRGVSREALGMDEDELRDKFRGSAEKEVKKTLLTDAIARQESVSVDDAELDARLTEIAEARGESLARVKAEYEKEGGIEALRVVMREEKVIDLLLERAHVTKVSEAEEAAAKASETEDPAENSAAPKEAADAAAKPAKAKPAKAKPAKETPEAGQPVTSDKEP